MKKQGEGFRSGTDALLLAAYVLRHRPQCESFVELGCGDGLAMHSLVHGLQQVDSLHKASIRALGVDIQEAALLQAQERDFAQAQVHFLQADMTQKKAFREAVRHAGFESASCVMANPPYYITGRPSPNAARALALHEMPQEKIAPYFCSAARDILAHHGWFFLIYAADKLMDILQTLQEYQFGVRSLLPIHTRPNKAARWVLLAARKGAAHDVQIEPHLCLYARSKGDRIHRDALKFCPWL